MNFYNGDRVEFALIYKNIPEYKSEGNATGIIRKLGIVALESVLIRRAVDTHLTGYWRDAEHIILISRKQTRR